MKRKTMRRLALRTWLCAMLLVCACAQAQAMDAAQAESWLEQFASALSEIAPINDSEQTTDPARAGQYLIEYEFGTVLAGVPESPVAGDILEVDVCTSQVTDCRGARVGMGMDAALDGEAPHTAGAQLSVLSTQEEGYGWSWAYVSGGGVYGVEYIAYDGDEHGMTEYTLTYVIDQGVITAIRMKAANATMAQAQEGLATAREMQARQFSELAALKNEQPIFSSGDLQVMGGGALGVPVAQLIARLGEPQEIQTLPNAQGRILVYDGAVVRLAFQETTGEEVVRGVSVSSSAISGPRGLTVGFSVREATALFACEEDVSSRGGTLYLAGEAAGEAPYGEITVQGGELHLRYACVTQNGETALLEAGVADGAIAYWSLSYERDLSGTEGGI